MSAGRAGNVREFGRRPTGPHNARVVSTLGEHRAPRSGDGRGKPPPGAGRCGDDQSGGSAPGGEHGAGPGEGGADPDVGAG